MKKMQNRSKGRRRRSVTYFQNIAYTQF